MKTSLTKTCLSLAALVPALLSSCSHSDEMTPALPRYTAPSPAIDTDDWRGTTSQAEWKENERSANGALLHRAIHEYGGY